MKPVPQHSNRIIAARQRRRAKLLHAKRLSAINNRKKGKGTLDNKAPKTIGMSHLIVNAKRDKKMEERFDQIEKQNKILLEKMTKIMKSKVFIRKLRATKLLELANETAKDDVGKPRQ